MKVEEVPQENNKTLEGVRKAVYAVGEDGTYTTVPSDGWNIEEIVTSQAVEEYDRQARLALEEVKKGLVSPLVYHMHKNRMDVALLAQTTGFFKWTIKRDFKKETFDKMSPNRMKIYADVMGIVVSELSSIPA